MYICMYVCIICLYKFLNDNHLIYLKSVFIFSHTIIESLI